MLSLSSPLVHYWCIPQCFLYSIHSFKTVGLTIAKPNPFFPVGLNSFGVIVEVEIPVHSVEFPVLHIRSHQISLCRPHCASCVFDDWQVHVYGMDFVLRINLALQNLSCPLVMLRCNIFPCLLIVVVMWLWDTKVFIANLYALVTGSPFQSLLISLSLLPSSHIVGTVIAGISPAYQSTWLHRLRNKLAKDLL